MLLMGGGGGVQRRAFGLDLGGGRTVYTGRATEQALKRQETQARSSCGDDLGQHLNSSPAAAN